MAVSLKKSSMREYTPIHIMDEEETIAKPSCPEPEKIEIEVVDKIQPPQISDTTNNCEKQEKIGKYSGLPRSDMIEVVVKSALWSIAMGMFLTLLHFMFPAFLNAVKFLFQI